MSELTIQLAGNAKLKERLVAIKTLDLRPEFVQLGDYLKNYYSGEAFLSQGQVFGQPWAPLKNTAGKSSKYTGQPLERTGKMRNAFEFDARNTQVRVFNQTPYFPYHQSAAPRRVLPRRVMLGFNSAIKSKAREVLKSGVKRILHEQ